MQLVRRSFIAAALAGLSTLVATPAPAQDYPTKPIKIIVPLAAGGQADILARAFAQKLGETTGHTVVVENRTGGGGATGTDAVAKSAPDGYTLLMGFHATLSILQHLGKLPYDPAKDFAPVILLAVVPNVLVVHPSVPARSVKELIDYAKANPGKVTYASQGVGSTGHMGGEQFKLLAGVDIVHVPYRGAAPAIQDLVAGHVNIMFDILSLALSHMKEGKSRGLAIAAPQRVSLAPDLPTMAEAGLPDLEGGPWFGLVAPAGTPQPVIDWLNREAKKVFSAPDVRERFQSQGAVLPLGTPAEFSAHIAAETKRWGEVVRRAGIKVE
jgi:tripartite-type tricarboxylate transporter receptor subunit TctC